MFRLENSIEFGFILTIFCWVIAQKIATRYKTPLTNPVFLSVLVIITLLKGLIIPYDTYKPGGDVLQFMLGPCVVALAVPLKRHWETIKRNGFSLFISITAGSVTGILSAAGTVLLLDGSRTAAVSLSPKSVTTPIAMALSNSAGGIESLTAAVVIITGILGAMFGPELLRLCGITNHYAVGTAVGTASHGIGTARMLTDSEKAGSFSGIGMILNGIITSVLLPFVLPVIMRYFS